MHLLTETIMHLRKACPIFEQRVAGTQNFAAATNEDSDIEVPACFVVPMNDTAEKPLGGGSTQQVTERFATIVVADNSKNARSGRGLSAEATLRGAKNQLIKALQSWSPVSLALIEDVYYARSQHLAMNNARIWHQYEWVCSYFVNGDPESQDAYQAFEKVIDGYYPNVDATKIKLIAANRYKGISMNPSDPETYDVVFQALTDTQPDWIKFRSTKPGTGQETDAGDVLMGGHRTVDEGL